MLKLNLTLTEILFFELICMFLGVLYLIFNAVANFLEGFNLCYYVLINFFLLQ